MTISTCKDCKERYPACHDHYRKYLDEKERKECEKAAITKKAMSDTEMKRLYSANRNKRLKKYKEKLW